MATDWQAYLTGRGISDKTVQRYCITGHTYDERPCIRYRTINFERQQAHRIKFTDGNRPKYKWDGRTDQSAYRYYSPGGLSGAIEKDGGKLYWLSGEMDVWTVYEALGYENSTGCFGEGSVPDTVAVDLAALGVKRVVMYPDLDKPGMKAANKLYHALLDTDISLVIWKIAGEVTENSGYDLNKLWQDVQFDAARFTEALKRATVLSEDDLFLYVQEDGVKTDGAQPALDLDFGSLFHEWIEVIINSLGQPDMKEGRVWRWHCPLPGHDDKHPSFRVASGSRCKMPMCTCGVQDKPPTDAWNEVAQARGVDRWEEYKARKKAEAGISKPAQPNTNGAKALPTHTPEEPLWVDSHAIYSQIWDHLEGRNVPDIDFIECPLEVLHEFGGFARIMFPGKLVYINGISGGGKTSLGETMGEKLLKQGYDFVWYGPEWTPYEMGLRSLQRNGGLEMTRMAEGFMWDVQGNKGIPENKRKGSPFPTAAAADSVNKIINMASWPGRSYFLTEKANRLSLSDMLATVEAIVDERRAAGRKVVAFFFDYLQRANKKGRGDTYWSEEVIAEIKRTCEAKQLIGFVMVQPRKDDSQGVRDGMELTEASGQGISDQQCNLYLAIHPIFENGEMLSYGKIKVVKNSMGKLGEVLVPTDFSRLCWIDKKAVVKTYNLNQVMAEDEGE
jgi:hypothetical protein